MVYSDLAGKVSITYNANDSNYPEQYFVTMAGNVSGNVALEIGSRSDKGAPYVRSKSSNGYTEWRKIITNADIDGHLYCSPNGPTGIDGGATGSQTKYRLQINNSGDINIYKSTDGGKTWPGVKKIASFET